MYIDIYIDIYVCMAVLRPCMIRSVAPMRPHSQASPLAVGGNGDDPEARDEHRIVQGLSTAGLLTSGHVMCVFFFFITLEPRVE